MLRIGDRIEIINDKINKEFFSLGDTGTIVGIIDVSSLYYKVQFDEPYKYDGLWCVDDWAVKKI